MWKYKVGVWFQYKVEGTGVNKSYGKNVPENIKEETGKKRIQSPQVPEVKAKNLDRYFHMTRISKQTPYSPNWLWIEFGPDGINLGRSLYLIAPQVPGETRTQKKEGEQLKEKKASPVVFKT